jgi:hypothetical protein
MFSAVKSPEDSTEVTADAPVGGSINRNISRVLALWQLVQTYELGNRSDYASADQQVNAGTTS